MASIAAERMAALAEVIVLPGQRNGPGKEIELTDQGRCVACQQRIAVKRVLGQTFKIVMPARHRLGITKAIRKATASI
ncbi:MAG: hypothetical protein CML66_04760 [Rhodobacteraceae bacterium]|nr:hypothetical protein [Paracoccaceae bacterium]MAY43831.1 hypothetical protein [Paracoccaceae bacterium]